MFVDLRILKGFKRRAPSQMETICNTVQLTGCLKNWIHFKHSKDFDSTIAAASRQEMFHYTRRCLALTTLWLHVPPQVRYDWTLSTHPNLTFLQGTTGALGLVYLHCAGFLCFQPLLRPDAACCASEHEQRPYATGWTEEGPFRTAAAW